MGCDIHCYLERKDGDRWELVDAVKIDRDYNLFGILAGVRNQGGWNPIASQRGLPDDASEELKAIEFSSTNPNDPLSTHSHSWLTIAELIEYPWSTHQSSLWTPKEACTHFWINTMPWLQLQNPDNRIVFWFDN